MSWSLSDKLASLQHNAHAARQHFRKSLHVALLHLTAALRLLYHQLHLVEPLHRGVRHLEHRVEVAVLDVALLGEVLQRPRLLLQ